MLENRHPKLFHGSPQSLQANSRIVPQNRPLRSHFIIIHIQLFSHLTKHVTGKIPLNKQKKKKQARKCSTIEENPLSEVFESIKNLEYRYIQCIH
jgi:hypothetical protein